MTHAAEARVRAAHAAAGRADALGAWITPVASGAVLDAAARLTGGEPLAGWTLAVKDNIDVLGLPTTAGHPAFARVPPSSAPAVQALVDAGAIVVGKTNMDQFATGLVGTRSPFGVCHNPHAVDHIAGGSSSGSAVAVAVGAADLGLATDTAGSGRVPAALCGIVGLKPTRGLVSTRGVVPAIAGLDCVSVLARTVGEAAAALGLIARFDTDDPWSRVSRRTPSVVVPRSLRIGVPRAVDLDGLDMHAMSAWTDALDALANLGTVAEIDCSPYLEAGALLYEGAFVTARWNAFGEFLLAHPDGADPTVTNIVRDARNLPASALVADVEHLRRCHRRFARTWDAVDIVAMPTVGIAPTIEAVAASPVGVNRALGRFTNGTNLLDLCAAAVPAGTRGDGIPFGLTFLGPAFADTLVAIAAARLCREPDPPSAVWDGSDTVGFATVVVVGAHLSGQPLNYQLTSRGGRLVHATTTAPSYRLHALPTDPPKPGMVRVETGGAAIAVEVWRLPLDRFGEFVLDVPAPLVIGTVELADGSRHPGFLCEDVDAACAPDISRYGGWLAYRNTLSQEGQR
ncbi:MAG TPA: allophanate hydrolase [Acidimicrobiia bacterium]|nr:allophanate hydrolase [Acidimicrobiia bacterium]